MMWILKYWKHLLISVSLILSFSSGWYVKGTIEQAKANIVRQNDLAAREQLLKDVNKYSAYLEHKLFELNKVNKTINKQLEKELAKDIYSKCIVPPSGVSILNKAITADTSESDNPVP